MHDPQENRPDSMFRRATGKFLVLGALAAMAAAAAGLVFLGFAILGHGEAQAQPPLSHFIPPRQQLAALEIEPVKLGIVHDAAGGPGRPTPTIPARAVIYQGDAARVWVAGNDGSLSLREVMLGAALGDALEVRRGLSPGEKVITNGSLFTHPALNGE